MTEPQLDPGTSRTSASAGAIQLPRRWEQRASRLGRTLQEIVLVLFAAAGAYFFRPAHPVLIALLIVFIVWAALWWLKRSNVYEFVIDEKEMYWGWQGVRDHDGWLNYEFITAFRFHRRRNGSGAIEVVFENGNVAFLPAEFTEQAQTADEIIATLKQVAPDADISVD